MGTYRQLVDLLSEDAAKSEHWYSTHLQTNQPKLALNNAALLIVERFELGLLHWRKGETAELIKQFRACAKVARESEQLSKSDHVRRDPSELYLTGRHRRLAAVAAYFLAEEIVLEKPQTHEEEPGQESWFERAFIDACVAGQPVDRDQFEASKRKWLSGKKGRRSHIAEWDFYFSGLFDEWAHRPIDEILAMHRSLYAARAKRSVTTTLSRGEGQHNEVSIDYVFAMILKRIGVTPLYPHVWPL